MNVAVRSVVPLGRQSSVSRYRVRGLLGQPALAAWIEAWCRDKGYAVVGASPSTGIVRINGPTAAADRAWVVRLDRALRDFNGRSSGGSPKPDPTPVRRISHAAERMSAPPRLASRARPASARQSLKSSEPLHTHATPLAHVLRGLECDGDGLSSGEAARRLARDGANAIADVTARNTAEILLAQFKSVPVALLGASAGLALTTRAYADAAAIGAVLAVNSGLGFYTERRAEQTVSSLRRLAPRMATALRDGRERLIPARDVVVGDVLVLKPGEAVAADARVLESHRLATNEASLTGESLPVRKAPSDAIAPDTPLGERSNMVHLGTVVSGGMGRAIVTATGENTMLGRIRALAQTAEAPRTRLQAELDRLAKGLAIGASALCLGVFAIGLLRGRPLLPLLRTAVSLGVAAIPEGLPTVATSLLASGIRSLEKRHVYARRLDALENLGAIDTICFDKTGTLTENRMRVASIAIGPTTHRLDAGLAVDRHVIPEEWHLVSILCSEVERNGDSWEGSSTETALIELAEACGYNMETGRREYPRLAIKHRSEHHPYMVTQHASGSGTFIAVKGRPDEVLARCTWWHAGGEPKKLTPRLRKAMLAPNNALAHAGHRVLGLAYRRQTDHAQGETGGLTWIGLAALADALRPNLPAMMRRFRAAGIRPIMITGDQVGTAQAVASAIELDGAGSVVDAASLPESAEQLAEVVEQAAGFARTSPAMKLEIVRALQRRGHVVAMTGDGINDGPALKTADVGVAMGVTGTDFAHAMSDLVLKDDHPAALLSAIEEGRTAYVNVKKAVRYLVATNMSELAATAVAVAAGLPDPLDPLALLWTNLVTDIWPAIALGLEPPEPDVLGRPPISLADGLLDREEWRRVATDAGLMALGALASFGFGLARYGAGRRASTLAFTTLTSSQLLYALSARSDAPILDPALRPNPLLRQAVVVSLAAQASTVLFPPLRRLLRTTPIGFADALLVAGMSVLPMLVRELMKRRRIAQRLPAHRVDHAMH